MCYTELEAFIYAFKTMVHTFVFKNSNLLVHTFVLGKSKLLR